MPPLMQPFRILIARLRGLFRRDIVAGEIRDELEFHVNMRADDYVRQGAAPEEARRAASRRVGNLAVLQDKGYDVRGGGVMETILQDMRYSVRLLRNQPAFSIVAILTLALGIGISTALFSVIDAALLRPLPFSHPEQLVSVNVLSAFRRGSTELSAIGPSLTDARDWRAGSRAITAVGVARERRTPSVVVDAGAGPERIVVNELSEGLLDVYGVAPILGRPIVQSDVAVGAPAVVLLGYGYWQSHFGGDPSVLNRTVRFVEGPATIVGVLPATFFRHAAVWRPQKLDDSFWRSNFRGTGADTYARLAPGVSLADAERQLSELTQRVAAARGESTNVKVRLTSLYQETTSGFSTTVDMLTWAVGFILLIACVNVAGLLLARGALRRPELAIRASIGAGRMRLIRQLLTESLVLALAGGALGVVFAWMSLDALIAIIPLRLPQESTAAINMPVLGFSLALSVTTAMLFGLMPAFRLSRVSLVARFGGGARRHGSALSKRGGQWLIGIEVALAVVLLAGAGLLVRSFAHAMSVDVGFDPSAILTIEVAPIDQNPAALNSYYPELLSRIRSIPGVVAVGAVDFLPIFDAMSMSDVKREGGRDLMMVIRHTLPGYASAMGMTVRQGRLPSDAELASGSTRVMINEEAAKQLFPNSPAVGRTVDLFQQPHVEVVAVVGNVRQNGPLSDARPELTVLSAQTITQPMRVVVRPAPGARISVDQLRQAALSVGPKVFLERIRVGSDWLDDSVVTPRRRTLLFSLLGGLGLVLTLVGIFGTTAYAVARRTQEIGVRMAFGARPNQVVRTMLTDAAWPVSLGLAIGLGGAMFSTKIIAKFLFQTTPTDPLTFASVAILLGIAASLAAWLPARRAARVDPIAALRAE